MDNRERISQTDAVVEELKRYFLSDALKVGDKLPTEKMLCETYSVGRSTVREAIRTLQVMGYVEIRPGRGAFLAAKHLTRVDATLTAWVSEHKPSLEETVRIRQALETLAVRFAIENGTDAELARVDLCRLAFEDSLFRKDYAALASLDEGFHRAIVTASHSELLETLNSVVIRAFREWRDLSFRKEEYAAQAVVPHQRIATALLARDVELAELQMRRHLEQVRSDAVEGIGLAFK
ncbi:MAG: FadR family transcriptional regulator [Planctomycetaceae bacterium]|nr:FadR family transcriptional regulator [Planctomycetaceae bacterium]